MVAAILDVRILDLFADSSIFSELYNTFTADSLPFDTILLCFLSYH